jgi:hypothetical protein
LLVTGKCGARGEGERETDGKKKVFAKIVSLVTLSCLSQLLVTSKCGDSNSPSKIGLFMFIPESVVRFKFFFFRIPT